MTAPVIELKPWQCVSTWCQSCGIGAEYVRHSAQRSMYCPGCKNTLSIVNVLFEGFRQIEAWQYAIETRPWSRSTVTKETK